MTLKEEIMAALASEEASVKINDVARLYRWTKSGIGEDVDGLHISFKYVCGVKGGWSAPISARDYDGIIAEIEAATSTYMAMCAEQMNSNLRAGYR